MQAQRILAFYNLKSDLSATFNPKHGARHMQSHKPSEIPYILPERSRDDGALFGYEYIVSQLQPVIAQSKKRLLPMKISKFRALPWGVTPGYYFPAPLARNARTLATP